MRAAALRSRHAKERNQNTVPPSRSVTAHLKSVFNTFKILKITGKILKIYRTVRFAATSSIRVMFMPCPGFP